MFMRQFELGISLVEEALEETPEIVLRGKGGLKMSITD